MTRQDRETCKHTAVFCYGGGWYCRACRRLIRDDLPNWTTPYHSPVEETGDTDHGVPIDKLRKADSDG